MAAQQHRTARPRLSELWAGVSAGRSWRRFLDALGPAGLEDDVLNPGLTSRNREVREETRWFAVSHGARGARLRLRRLPDEASPWEDETPWARAGRELLVRLVTGSKPTEDISQPLEQWSREHRADAASLADAKELLTSSERAALQRALGEIRQSPPEAMRSHGQVTPALRETLRRRFGDRSVPPLEADPIHDDVSAQTFLPVTPGMLTSLLNAVNCTVDSSDNHRFAAASLAYLEDGRSTNILVGSDFPKECAPAIAALAFLTIAAPGQVVRPGDTQRLLLPMDASAVACADQPPWAAPYAALRIGEEKDITAPNKTRHFNPVYPKQAQEARIQGTVVVVSEITATGCVRQQGSTQRSRTGSRRAARRLLVEVHSDARGGHTGARDHDRDGQFHVEIDGGMNRGEAVGGREYPNGHAA